MRNCRGPSSVSIVFNQMQAPTPLAKGPIFFSGCRFGFGGGCSAVALRFPVPCVAIVQSPVRKLRFTGADKDPVQRVALSHQDGRHRKTCHRNAHWHNEIAWTSCQKRCGCIVGESSPAAWTLTASDDLTNARPMSGDQLIGSLSVMTLATGPVASERRRSSGTVGTALGNAGQTGSGTARRRPAGELARSTIQ